MPAAGVGHLPLQEQRRVLQRRHAVPEVADGHLHLIPVGRANEQIAETTVSEINIAGLPGVTVPAGAHACGAPFSLIFVGRLFSEATLLAFAHDYEQATHHRHALVPSH